MKTAETTIDQLEQLLIGDETHIARLPARQIAILGALDLAQVPLSDGSRNLTEWAAARMDLAPETAQRLVQTAHRLADPPDLAAELRDGLVSFERWWKNPAWSPPEPPPNWFPCPGDGMWPGSAGWWPTTSGSTDPTNSRCSGTGSCRSNPPWTKPLTNCGDNSPASTVEPSNRPSRSGPISSRPCPTGNDAPAPNATPTPWSPSP